MDRLANELQLHCLSFVKEHDHGRLTQYVWPRGSMPPAIPVGETLPMRPPLGMLFVAWGSDADFDAWLDLDPGLTPAHRSRFHEQAAAVRRLGFVVEARPRTMEDAAFARVIDDRTSPRRDGKLMELLADHGPAEHILTDLGGDDARNHDVHVIGAPTFGPSGAAARSISVIGFTGPVAGEEIRRIGAAVRATADRITADLGGTPPRPAARAPSVGAVTVRPPGHPSASCVSCTASCRGGAERDHRRAPLRGAIRPGEHPMADLVIRNGTVVDGTGRAAPARPTSPSTDGRHHRGRRRSTAPAAARSTPTALLVTPGFVDIHTHYDGQATWDPLLAPVVAGTASPPS